MYHRVCFTLRTTCCSHNIECFQHSHVDVISNMCRRPSSWGSAESSSSWDSWSSSGWGWSDEWSASGWGAAADWSTSKASVGWEEAADAEHRKPVQPAMPPRLHVPQSKPPAIRRGGWFSKCQVLCKLVMNGEQDAALQMAREWEAGPWFLKAQYVCSAIIDDDWEVASAKAEEWSAKKE